MKTPTTKRNRTAQSRSVQRRVMPIPGFRVLHKCGHYENHEGINKAQADRLAKRACELCAEDTCLMH